LKDDPKNFRSITAKPPLDVSGKALTERVESRDQLATLEAPSNLAAGPSRK
jgi:hypothetical protein